MIAFCRSPNCFARRLLLSLSFSLSLYFSCPSIYFPPGGFGLLTQMPQSRIVLRLLNAADQTFRDEISTRSISSSHTRHPEPPFACSLSFSMLHSPSKQSFTNSIEYPHSSWLIYYTLIQFIRTLLSAGDKYSVVNLYKCIFFFLHR